jgi:hypothetical protein
MISPRIKPSAFWRRLPAAGRAQHGHQPHPGAGRAVFAGLEQLGGKVLRAATLDWNELVITLQCVACNVKRLVWLAAHEPAH